MSASARTVREMVSILREEVGDEVALRIVKRLRKETIGNQSYQETLRRLERELA